MSTALRTTAADWRALGTGVRLVVTDPALLDSCNLLLARYLAEVAGPAWQRAAAPATTPTARSAWYAAP
ncbi:hypothetical protein SAMN04487981_1316 [Streptomyces sp. cf386]|uniref:hypothetical protein n=1 Tax=Streptomyces sp. cf386 TaxID=1761904 RepID=UPI00088B1AF6|nr:hypothetical protein [Streptomyces sp. cf386]SDP64995.1 hypothetical protein SAMN04487981_1316 [Streptomyces sp. cf386]